MFLTSTATGQSTDGSAHEVEVKLIKELMRDGEIQALRLKGGLHRLVVTEKTANCLDSDANV